MTERTWDRTALALSAVAVVVDHPRSGSEVHTILAERFNDPPSKSTVYRTLSRLHEAGYVRRNESEQNDRSFWYEPTREGEQAVKAYVGNIVTWLDGSPRSATVADSQR